MTTAIIANEPVLRIQRSEGLTAFPEDLFEHCDTLELLDLSNNKISRLPENFGDFKALKILFLSNNHFTEFPKVVANCPNLTMIGFKSNQITTIPEDAFPKQLQWLILTDNKIAALPKSIGECFKLQKCALAGNQLTHLPDEMAQCRNLELLRISANQLQELPQWLVELPRLAWLAFSGNPCTAKIPVQEKIATIAWEELAVLEQLGEGASGIISKAIWKNQTVAIKVFKGEVTSDGYPEDELATCLATGNHPNLVSLLSEITGHPENKKGIVMTLITPEFSNLGMPPNFDTCTRDVFPSHQQLNLNQALTILQNMAHAAQHLHSKGILHGDFYAHNILYQKDGASYLGDFGAASCYDKESDLSSQIERIEVRAFGYLMEDLLAQIEEEANPLFKTLRNLKEDCLSEDYKNRPDFEAILSVLKGIL